MGGIIWLEGVDFAAHLFDTNDLSTRRGASLAYLHAVDWAEEWLKSKELKPDPIVRGASIGAWQIAVNDPKDVAKDLLEELRKTGENAQKVWDEAKKAYENCNDGCDCKWPFPPPFAHLSFVCGWAEGTNEEALSLARARARARQFRRFTLRPAGQKGSQFCPVDRTRPALTQGFLPGNEDALVSPSVLARRAYGRYARQGFYAGEAGPEWGKKFFTNTFEELVKDAPEELALSAKSKIAVFYADGNGFTGLAGNTIESRRAFSGNLRRLQRGLLGEILKAYDKCVNKEKSRKYFEVDIEEQIERKLMPCERLRLETLLWGGDELMFVMPSWLGLWFARLFFDTVKDWKAPGGEPLTFGAGLLICNYKTPIRVAQKIAKEELAEQAKEWGKKQDNGPCNGLSIYVMESVEPLEQGLAEMRKKMLKLKERLEDALVIPGGKVATVLNRADALKTGFPRSQLYRILHKARRDEWFKRRGEEDTRQALKRWLEKAGKDSGLQVEAFRLVEDYHACELGRHLLLNLYWLAELWDYLPPEAIKECAPATGEGDNNAAA
jgi:hypothetical protein